eukprot:TRINITY_DN83966_c0_g1_i1.p1 TRINITY_DN83966_c0_g1~~TRINITY_DN83966_c0_g1_i1.p1  ORF type:complete len:239 (+),score=36.20 TRINITY_DN83966_c0_g1_i1:27-743(+)
MFQICCCSQEQGGPPARAETVTATEEPPEPGQVESPGTPRASEHLVQPTFKTLEVEVSSLPCLKVEKVTDNHLLVRKVDVGGAVAAYNSEQTYSQEKVQWGDRIIAVNGKRGSAEELDKILEALEKLEKLTGITKLTIEKPTVLGLAIQRDKDELGLEVGPSPMRGAIIMDIRKDGCVAEYNKVVSPASRVKRNDLITGTFGKNARDETIMQRLNTCQEVKDYIQQDGALSISVYSYS